MFDVVINNETDGITTGISMIFYLMPKCFLNSSTALSGSREL
jgi:hypothetical protein